MEGMKIAIAGANGAVGQAILRRAAESAELTLVAAVRSAHAADEIRPLLGHGSSAVQISYSDPASLDAALQGSSAAIHLAGILFERTDSSYLQGNVESARGVVDAAKRCGVQKVVLISAIGADEASANGYYRTKGQAEALVRASGLRYTILRAPLLLGPETEGTAALVRHASGGKAKLIGGGRHFQQPLYVDDLARAALAAARPSVADNLTLDLVGPVSLPDRELVERTARALGREVRIASIPKGLVKFGLTLRGRTSGPGFSVAVLDVITADTRLDPQPAASALGIRLTGIDEMIQNSLGPTRETEQKK